MRSFYRNAAAVFLVYDVNKYEVRDIIWQNSKKSFDNLSEWLEEIMNSADQGAILVLMGNKTDTPEKYPLLFLVNEP